MCVTARRLLVGFALASALLAVSAPPSADAARPIYTGANYREAFWPMCSATETSECVESFNVAGVDQTTRPGWVAARDMPIFVNSPPAAYGKGVWMFFTVDSKTQIQPGDEVRIDVRLGPDSVDIASGGVRGGEILPGALLWEVRDGHLLVNYKAIPWAFYGTPGAAGNPLLGGDPNRECSAWPTQTDCGGEAGHAAPGLGSYMLARGGFYDLTGADFAARRDVNRGISIASNAFNVGPPHGDPTTGTATVPLAAPHWRDPERTQLNEGRVQVWLPASLLQSRGFSVDLAKSLYSQVEVTSSDGQPIKVSLEGLAGGLLVSVSGFHYSAPTLRVQSKVNSPSAAAPPALAKPSAKVAVSRKKRLVTATVKAESGVNYKMMAKPSGKTKSKAKAGKCALRSDKREATCSVKLPKGSWSLQITPSRGAEVGPVFTKTVRIR